MTHTLASRPGNDALVDDLLVLEFSEVGLADVAKVGGKNASLGELFQFLRPLGVNSLDGFATTAAAYRMFLSKDLELSLRKILSGIQPGSVSSLAAAGREAREAVLATRLPAAVVLEIERAYDRLFERLGYSATLAVRSSATAEDLPGVSFAGQHETFLNVAGKKELVDAVHRCYASIFTDRAIDYRIRNGFDHLNIAISVGVQPMVRSDESSSGVIFTLDPESGFRDVVVVSGTYGLGESIVQGTVNPDEWTVFKPTLLQGKDAVISRTLGTKETKIVFNSDFTGTESTSVLGDDRARFCLQDTEVSELAQWACLIEDHYSQHAGVAQPMDIEWAKDGETGSLYILQARPETVHSSNLSTIATTYHLVGTPPEPLITGQAVGERIGSGVARVVLTPADLAMVEPGEVLVAASTDPDWEPIMKRVSAIVTDQGGRTAHAAIVSREIGIPCVVGTGDATKQLHTGDIVTVCCAEGSRGAVYPGEVPFDIHAIDLHDVPATRTELMVNVGDPSRAFAIAALPNAGVGLARIEFIITNSIGIHPMALCRYPNLKDKEAKTKIGQRLQGAGPTEFFVQRLSEGVAQIAAAFYPKPVIVRTSDFKSNEYARLLGGEEFEPYEENPMLGFRGASRYYDPRYAEGFRLECLALRRVRIDMGFTNVKVMIPFCRTVEEARRVVDIMAMNGLPQGQDGLEIYGMCELPSNVLDADGFLEIFDGYSIGSNDLTQLTLGIDRDSGTVSHLFDERNFAVQSLITLVIDAGRRAGKHIGICGQAPSDYPDFAAWLVRHCIDSISLNPDSILKTIDVVAKAERPIKDLQPRAIPTQ